MVNQVREGDLLKNEFNKIKEDKMEEVTKMM